MEDGGREKFIDQAGIASLRILALCKYERSRLGMARKGTDYLRSNISENDLVCKPFALIIIVQSVFYAGL